MAAVDTMLRVRESTIKILQRNVTRAQHRMKLLANRKRTGRSYQIVELVYVKLQPCRQVSVHQGNPTLQPKYFGPYQIIEAIGKVAYRLQLPVDAMIYNVFHVSFQRPTYARIQASSVLPPQFQKAARYPQKVLDRKLVKRGHAPPAKLLIQWQGESAETATWEFTETLRHWFPDFSLEDREAREGATVAG